MPKIRVILLAGAALFARPVFAADSLKFGPPPPWVHPQSIPAAKPTGGPVALLLDDQQIELEKGKVLTYTEGALRIENSQGLAAGNLSLVWQPATDTVTVNKLHIIRDGKVIDVLANGQTFTVLRRETNLDAATLDGTLTATIQPEGLQQGDIIDLATTTERSDPVLKGHVEAMFGQWGGLPIQLAHASLNWTDGLHISVRQTPSLPAPVKNSASGMNSIDLSASDVQPMVPPKGAPDRFLIGRLAEATDYGSWSNLADLFMPLYRDASAIPNSGPLHDEVEKIRASTADPKARATQALALVQDRVRYVALLMGQGGYVPASAAQTWSRRFGDCKAKTALLLGILHALGIQAEPVLVQSKLGDMVADRLPMISLFDHVFVRAHIGGKDYWLDGTRDGDTDLDAIQTPNFGWGLPLVAHAELVHMVPKPLDAPNLEHHVSIDASAGIYAPAAATIEEIYRGDSAVGLNSLYSAVSADQRDQTLHDKAREYFDDFDVASSSVQFDKAKRELVISIKGTAKLNWKDGWSYIPTSSISFDPDFDRPAGPLHDVPLSIDYPRFVQDKATIKLPPGFAAGQKLSAPVHQTLAGVEYARSERVDGNVLTVDSSERSVVPEVAYKDALAAAPQLRSLDKDDLYLSVSTAYAPTPQDVAALKGSHPQSADDYFVRAGAEIANNDKDAAAADLRSGLDLDPKNTWALRKLAVISIDKGEYDAAEQKLAAAEAIDGETAASLEVRAYLAEKKHDFAGAADWYQKAIAKDPKDSYALSHRGVVLINVGRNDEAVANLNSVLAIDPKNAFAMLNRARAEINTGKFDDAERDAKALEALTPQDPSPHDIEGLVAQHRGNLQAAIDDFSKAFEMSRTNGSGKPWVEPLARRAEALSLLGRYDEALADIDRIFNLGQKDANVHLVRANILMRQGKRELVAAEADAMTRDNPQSDFAFIAAAKTYAAVGQSDKAMQAIDRALQIKPSPIAYVNRADVRPRADVEGRLADLDAALKLDPAMPEALTMKAALLAKAGRHGEALETYDRMPKSTTLGLNMDVQRATLLEKAGRTADAEKLFTTLRSSANSPDELNSLCWGEGTAGVMLDAAIEECREAVRLGNSAPQYVDSLGMALLKSGKLDEALAAYSEALTKAPLPSSYMGRAIIYARQGDDARANADLMQAKKLDPNIESTFADYGLTIHSTPRRRAAAAAAKPPTIVSITRE